MHFYCYHFKDFNNDTRHLTHIERSLYRDLMDLYYETEKPIPDNKEWLYRKLLCRSDEEKQALDFVLEEFFTIKKLKGDQEPCYHHNRIDREIKAYHHSQKNGNGSGANRNAVTQSNAVTQHNETVTQSVTPSVTQSNDTVTQQRNASVTNAERQKALRERKSAMVSALSEIGVSACSSMKTEELKALCEQHNVTPSVTQNNETVTQDSNESNDTVTQSVTPFRESIINNHKPITINHSIVNTPLTPHGGVTQDEPAGFQRFWEAYPNHNGRRKDKHKCLNHWRKYKLESLTDKIVQHVKAMTNTKKWREGYEPLAMSYLNGRQWLDGVPDETTPSGVIYKDGVPFAGFQHIDYTAGTYLREDGTRGF